MALITVKEYAKKTNRTVQAIYGAMNRHKKELGKHVTMKAGIYYIDARGQAILDSYITKNPVAVSDPAIVEELEQAKETISRLEHDLLEVQKKYTSSLEQITAGQTLLLESKQRIEEAERQQAVEKERADKAEKELEEMKHKSFFARLFGR
jgi:predicted transcriptional regulator